MGTKEKTGRIPVFSLVVAGILDKDRELINSLPVSVKKKYQAEKLQEDNNL